MEIVVALLLLVKICVSYVEMLFRLTLLLL